MNEFELINHLSRGLPTNPELLVGVGDDCAVIDSGQKGRSLLLKTDAVVEGIHFTSEAAPESIGHKALARPLSDIAAMAGRPIAALVTLGLPNNFDPARIQKIYGGMNQLAARHGLAIAGGEIVKNPERLLISISLLGDVDREKCVYREGSRPGDALFVTGELGGSIGGKHLEFEPRLEEARWLREHFPLHAMIDLSDGLAGDLRHLLESSKIGAELLVRAIPISRAARRQAGPEKSGKPPLLAALTDGEDYELLFTVSPRDAVPLADAWRKKFPKLKLSCIGKITPERGIKLRDDLGVRTLEAHGYMHFA